MYWKSMTALASCVLACGSAHAQQQAMGLAQTGGTSPAAVQQDPNVDPKDSPEETAKDAARDLKDSRFYNKPGATRAQYDADWQRCRLIARGSRTPSGTIPYFYNPAVISPVAAGIGGGLGAALAGAIQEGKQRRDNRRNCLLINGWRLVEVSQAESTRVAAMTEADRDAYFNTIVGAAEVKGDVTKRSDFSQPSDPAMKLDTPLTQPGALTTDKKIDPAAPIMLAANEAALVIAFRRVEPAAQGRSSAISLLRYDPALRDVIYRPKDWKKLGDKTTYAEYISSRDKKLPYEVQVLRLTPGSYVINTTTVGTAAATTTNCFGAPAFSLAAGEVAYLGDFVPYMDLELTDGEKLAQLIYSSHLEDARRTLATVQPALASAMKPAVLRNGATYACSGITMTRWDIAGAETLPAPSPPTAAASN